MNPSRQSSKGHATRSNEGEDNTGTTTQDLTGTA